MALPKKYNFNDYDNYITEPNPTTSAEAQSYFRNADSLVGALVDAFLWQPETNYANGDVVKSSSMPNGAEAVCVSTNGGKSSNVEPQWGSVGGENIADGTCFWKLRYNVTSVNGIEADNKGNIQLPVMQGSTNVSAGASGLVPAPPATSDELFLSNDGTYKEAGKVKTVNGKTGDVVVDLPVGHMYWSVEPNVSTGRLPALGATYNRSLYADLWAWANSVGLVKTESEWQAIASANDGNCAYYSSGDGSSTFRVPSIKCWVKGASSTEEVGSYLEAGLPNITGNASANIQNAVGTLGYQVNGAFKKGTISGAKHSNDYSVEGLGFDASRSNSIYGNSDTVQPPSIVGQWLIVAFGVAHNIGEADVANVMQAVETAQTVASEANSKIDGIVDYIVESYRNGTEWYEVYKSGKIRQGGVVTTAGWKNQTVTLLKTFANTNYQVRRTYIGINSNETVTPAELGTSSKATNKFTMYTQWSVKCEWIAEGQGA